jgi:integrase
VKRKLKHLPVDQWPSADLAAFAKAYEAGDIFDEAAGPGAHLMEGTRRIIRTAWRRWLGFLKELFPEALLEPPGDRLTPARLKAFIEHCSAETSINTVVINVNNLYHGGRLIAPERDWRWLKNVKKRLAADLKPEDRFERLVPGWHTLDYGIELMDTALKLPPADHKQREIQYRDGLLIAFLSFSLLRRRSIAALTLSRHVEVTSEGINILLFAEDTKAKRTESIPLLEDLVPYLKRYLREIRPLLLGHHNHDALWVSFRGCPLSAGRIYDIARARVLARFGKDMGLHDYRRAGATFLAINAPEQVGLIPSILQHRSPDIGEQHYNLAGSMQASRRHTQCIADLKAKLRPFQD